MGKEIIQEKRAPFEVWAGNLHNSPPPPSPSFFPYPHPMQHSPLLIKNVCLLFAFCLEDGIKQKHQLNYNFLISKTSEKSIPWCKK